MAASMIERKPSRKTGLKSLEVLEAKHAAVQGIVHLQNRPEDGARQLKEHPLAKESFCPAYQATR